MKYQLCPKCFGDGHLGRYNSPPFMPTTTTPICDVCHGAKTLLVPYDDAYWKKRCEAAEQVIKDQPFIPNEDLFWNFQASKERWRQLKTQEPR